MKGRHALLTVLLSVVASSASAQIVWDFDILVTGDTPLGSDWATLTIADTATDEVTMTLAHNATSTSPQFLTRLLLNLTTIPADLAASFVAPVLSIEWGDDAFSNVANLWDVDVMLETSNPQGRLYPGGSTVWTMTGTGLDSQDFNTLSTMIDGVDPMFGLLQLQGTPGGDDSAKLTVVPEPASFAVLGLGLIALVRRRRGRPTRAA
ncbi:MAG: PEP-CTERM sorting domain-containing protein [Armatimonadetes bacterium]|nr:PEP-CTERM sorting domain-containing protein [Armatimonadota bacterium]